MKRLPAGFRPDHGQLRVGDPAMERRPMPAFWTDRMPSVGLRSRPSKRSRSASPCQSEGNARCLGSRVRPIVARVRSSLDRTQASTRASSSPTGTSAKPSSPTGATGLPFASSGTKRSIRTDPANWVPTPHPQAPYRHPCTPGHPSSLGTGGVRVTGSEGRHHRGPRVATPLHGPHAEFTGRIDPVGLTSP